MSAASDLLAAYQAAELAILQRQSYTIGDRTLTFADLRSVQSMREKLERRVAAEANSGYTRFGVADFSAG
jgi:hypothetical protein